MPTKKYLNRDNNQKTSADDEWAHLTGIEEGPKLQVSDALDVQSRNIFVRGHKPKAVSTTDIIQEELLDAGHQTRTTDQYVKLVNAILDERLGEIDRIKNRKQIFDDDIESLRSESSEDFEKLKKIPIKELKSKDVSKLIKTISEEKGSIESRLEHHKSKADSLEKRIEEQDIKIRELDLKLKEKIIQEKENKEKKSASAIQDELKILGELYGLDKLSKALKKLNESGGTD
jgi:DNA-binding transcriptional ArsR family regulator